MSESRPPDLSILICTFDRPTMLARLLASLVDQAPSFPGALEIVVVDNHPAASARDVVQSATAAATPVAPIRYATESTPNISRARNAALALARAEIVLFLDDDQLPPKDFLRDLSTAWQELPGDVQGLRFAVRPQFTVPVPAWLEASGLFDGGEGEHGEALRRTAMGTGGFLARRTTFFAPGSSQPPFDETLGQLGGEDVDFFLRASRRGEKFSFAARPVLLELVPASRANLAYACVSARRKGRVDALLFHRSNTWPRRLAYWTKALLALAVAALTLPPAVWHGRAGLARRYALVWRQLGKLTVSSARYSYFYGIDRRAAGRQPQVLHLTGGGQEGGAERLLEQISSQASPDRPPLYFLYDTERRLPFARAIAARGHQVVTHAKRPGFDLGLLRELRRTILANDVRIVHTHDIGAMLHASLVRLSLPRLKLVHTEHTLHYWIDRPKYRRLHLALSLLFDAVVCVSDFVRQELSTRVRTSVNRLRVIPNGVDLQRFAQTSSVFGPGDRLRLVAIGRLDQAKNLTALIHAVGRLKAEGIPVELHHAGAGPDEDATRQLVHELDLEAEVHMHGYQEDVVPILALGDVFVSASKVECHPVAVLEAMAAGKVCILSDIPPHLALEGLGVAHFSLAEPKSLEELLLQAWRRPARFAHLGRSARLAAEQKFSLDAMLTRYRRLYAEV